MLGKVERSKKDMEYPLNMRIQVEVESLADKAYSSDQFLTAYWFSIHLAEYFLLRPQSENYLQ